MPFDVSHLFSPDVYEWVVLPFLIFLARVCDQTIGTVRIIFVARGYRRLAPVLGFFEVIIWLLAIRQIMQNLNNAACYVAYGAGFAAGNYAGLLLDDWLAMGLVTLRVISKGPVGPLINRLRAANFGVTTVDAQGATGHVQLCFVVLPRSEMPGVLGLVREMAPHSFCSVEEVKYASEGIFPGRAPFTASRLADERKGK